MPKPKQKKSVKRQVRVKKPTAKRGKKRVAKARRSISPVAVVATTARATSRPRKHPYRLRLASLLLLVTAALSNSAVVWASGQDMQRSEALAVEARVQLMQPKEYLYRQADIYALDFDRLEAIAYCESRWRMVKNKQSSAFGFFQIIDGTERYTPQYQAGGRKFDPFTNIDMAVYLYDRYGASPWFESKGCWQYRD